jgi:hypothetical protein
MHVAKAADVHQDVESELLANAESAQHLVVAPTVTQATVNDFAPPRFADLFYSSAYLPIRI